MLRVQFASPESERLSERLQHVRLDLHFTPCGELEVNKCEPIVVHFDTLRVLDPFATEYEELYTQSVV